MEDQAQMGPTKAMPGCGLPALHTDLYLNDPRAQPRVDCSAMSSKPRKARDPRRELLAALGKRVRTYRNQCQLTQQDLALKLDLSVAYVSLIERGHRNPPFLRVVAIAKALRTSPAMLVE